MVSILLTFTLFATPTGLPLSDLPKKLQVCMERLDRAAFTRLCGRTRRDPADAAQCVNTSVAGSLTHCLRVFVDELTTAEAHRYAWYFADGGVGSLTLSVQCLHHSPDDEDMSIICPRLESLKP
jgi:hypothetical protein